MISLLRTLQSWSGSGVHTPDVLIMAGADWFFSLITRATCVSIGFLSLRRTESIKILEITSLSVVRGIFFPSFSLVAVHNGFAPSQSAKRSDLTTCRLSCLCMVLSLSVLNRPFISQVFISFGLHLPLIYSTYQRPIRSRRTQPRSVYTCINALLSISLSSPLLLSLRLDCCCGFFCS